ncbi:MAG: hypothetical protein VYC34_11260, partial [Planctomycetota bacterium]|nr:hypothetical protein [Planctomycetota bacterium]
MEVNEKNQRERGAAGRRTRMGAATAVLLFAATATCALAILIGSLTSTRIDVTATREHALSPRTKMLLNRLEAPHEIVIVADFAAMDARVRQRIGDVLIEFEKATPLVQHSALDAASIEERDDYARLLNRLATLQPQRLQNHLAAIETAQSSLTSLSTQAMDVSQRLTAAREALAGAGEPGDPARQVAEQMKDLPGIAQGFSSVLSRAAEETVSLMEDRIAESEIPPVDLA